MLTVIIIVHFTAFVNKLQTTFLSFTKMRIKRNLWSSFLCILRMSKKDLIFMPICDIIYRKKKRRDSRE